MSRPIHKYSVQKCSNCDMYLTALPDHSNPAFDEKKHFSAFGKTNIIFNAVSTRSRCDNHIGCLSVKTVLSGEEWYGVNGRQVAVRPGTFLVLNDGQDYSCRINNTTTRTVSVFFARDFAKSVLYNSMHSIETLIDSPFEESASVPAFFPVLHQFDNEIKNSLLSLIKYKELTGSNDAMIDEHLVSLLGELIKIHNKDLDASKNIFGIRSSTQKEIYKRVCIARDFLHSYYSENNSLKSVAAAASLSVPQLVRQFKAAFGTTPHRYIVNIRLQCAADLLRTSNYSIADVATQCGFENASAFSRAFKNKYNLQPGQFANL